MDIEKLFKEYKDITLSIIKVVEKEDYEKLEEKFYTRQEILDNIEKLNYSVEDLKKLYCKYIIENLEISLKKEIEIRKEQILVKLKESQNRRKVLNGYNNLQTKAVYLSKEL